jgi:hypothetical protein
MNNEEKPDPEEMLMRVIKVAEILAKGGDIAAGFASSNENILNAHDPKNNTPSLTGQKTQK